LSVITGPANSFVFLYAQNIVHQPGYITAIMVVGAGVSGLVGLIVGQWLADRNREATNRRRRHGGNRRVRRARLLRFVQPSGRRLHPGGLSGSILAPAAGAMVNELFPTSIRASVSGWWVAAGVVGAAAGLVTFGAVADIGNRFEFASTVTFLPAAAAAGLFWLLPETRGLEPEQLAGANSPGPIETANRNAQTQRHRQDRLPKLRPSRCANWTETNKTAGGPRTGIPGIYAALYKMTTS
jgi:MFS family permease